MYPTTLRRALAWGVLLLLAGLVAGHRGPVRAQKSGPGLRLGKQEIEVAIDDRHGLAVTTVRQELLNKEWAEQPASFDLPIPDDAAILRYEVLEPPARKGEKPEDRGTLASAGRSLYRVTVSRVPGGKRARVEIAYAELLARRGRRRKYVYPVPSPEGAVPGSVSFRARIEARAAPERVSSSSHAMTVRHVQPRVAQLSYDLDHPLDGRDLVVDYEVPSGSDDARASLAVLAPPDENQEPWFLLTLPSPAVLLRGRAALDRPVDVVFCMDMSGSTRGRKLNAIQEAVHDGLADLSPNDRFGVVAFDDDARDFRRDLAPAVPGSVNAAVRFVNRLRAGAGSDPQRALQAARQILGRRRGAGDRAAIIAILVDHEDPAGLGKAAAALKLQAPGIRVVALGALPDSRLMSYQLSGAKLKPGPTLALSRAAVTYGPALTHATLDPGVLNGSYLYPAPDALPALPLSTPLVLTGRLEQAPLRTGELLLRGSVGGQQQSLRVPYVWEPLSPDSPVRALWASRRIHRLKQLAQQERGDQDELLGAIDRVRAEGGLALAPGR